MSSWLSPEDVQNTFKVRRTTSFLLIKEYKASGGEYIKIGKLTRVPEEQFTEFLKERGNEEHH